MSLTLQKIYDTTKNKYRLTLITPPSTLEKIMNWVYIGEDVSTLDYLNGGELVITTGVCIHNSQELYHFINTLIHHNCCGLIINIGQYLNLSHITKEVKQLCSEHNFALFTMPWEISFQSITRDYYHQIFEDNQTDFSLTEYFLSVIRQDSELERNITLLDEIGFSKVCPYCVCLLNYQNTKQANSVSLKTEATQTQLLYLIDTFLHKSTLKHHIMIYKENIVFICCDSDLTLIEDIMKEILNKLSQLRPHDSYQIGIGSVCDHLKDLFISYKRADAALRFAQYYQSPILSFSELGFFRLLLSVHDSSLLNNYIEEQLGFLISYDQEHHSDYLDTLYHYLMLNGSIQAIATTMFCHRNTINYRVKNLKELLNCDLDNATVRFNLMTAFCIKKYLEIL